MIHKIVFFCLLFAGSAVAAEKCDYCAEIESIQSEFKKLKPDPLDEATIDKQLELVVQTSNLVTKLAKAKNPPKEDIERMVKIMAVAAPFDAQHFIAENVMAALGKNGSFLFDEIKRLEKTSALSKSQADRLKLALAVAQDEQAGQDPSAKKAKKK